MKKTIIFSFWVVLSIIYGQDANSYKVMVQKLNNSDEYWEIWNTNLVFHVSSTFGLALKGTFVESVLLRVHRLSYGGFGEFCYEETSYEYNYYTDDYEYITKYDDCHSIDGFYYKANLFDILPSGTVFIDYYGENLDIESVLIPCDESCFN